MKKYILLGIVFLLTFASSVTLFAGGGENGNNEDIQPQQIAAMDKFYQEIRSPRFLEATAATNPPYAEINAAINDLSSKCKIPAIIIKAMVYQESSWRQFDDAGAPLISPDNGIGLTQVTVSDANDSFETKTLGSIVPGIQGDNPFMIEISPVAVDINLLKTDWRYNLEIGCRILLAKKVASVSEGDDATLLENWWYTLAYYNGFAVGGANDPANPIYSRVVSENWHWLSISRFPYQECVFNIVAQLYTLPIDLAPYFEPRAKVTLPGPVAVNIGAGHYDYVDESFSGGKSITYHRDNRAVVDGQTFDDVTVHWVEFEPTDVPEAKSGFQRPMINDHSGYTFNEWAPLHDCYHPGWDYNGPGGGDDDRGTDILAVADGLVVDVNTTAWGNIIIEHLYKGITVYSQYGHLDSVLVSEGQIVSKGQHIGELGDRGTDDAHLHWEIRESDHPDPRNAAYWNKSAFQSQATIENWYEDPQWWVDTHGPYQPVDLVLQNITVEIGQTKSWEASNSITAAGDGTFFIIAGDGAKGGDATFTAGSYIILKPGFTSQRGSKFDARIVPNLKQLNKK